MTIDTTLERPIVSDAGNAEDPRIAILKEELARQGELMYGACLISDELRGLAILFHGVFCDTTLTEGAEFRLQRVSAAYLVENLLKSLADRLETADTHASTSRIHAFQRVAR